MQNAPILYRLIYLMQMCRYLIFILSLSLIPLKLSAAQLELNVRQFGAVGDGVTDDTAAIRKALATGRSLYFPSGVYRLTDGIALPPSVSLRGDFSPRIAPFPMKDDDKRFLHPDRLKEMPGTTLLFAGSGKTSADTGRKDRFSRVRYALKTKAPSPFTIANLAIVMDMVTVQDNGRPTAPDDDQRADYDVGLLVDDSSAGTMRNVSVAGYWNKAGMAVVSRGVGDNPDYNTFWDCSFMGDVGVALLGAQQDSPGLSGTQFYGCRIFASDHHSRQGSDWGTTALYIDGNTPKSHELNGHYFFGGGIRTYLNDSVMLDHATNVTFTGVVFEVPAFERGDHDHLNKSGRIAGTENTQSIHFQACRKHSLRLTELAKNMKKGVITDLGSHGFRLLSGDRMVALKSSPNLDPGLQLSSAFSGGSSGWNLLEDVSRDRTFQIRYDNESRLELSPEGGLFAPTVGGNKLSIPRRKTATLTDENLAFENSRMRIRSRDRHHLKRISGGSEGDILILEGHPDSAPIEIGGPVESSNMILTKKMIFDQKHDRLTLLFTEGEWVETARADFSP